MSNTVIADWVLARLFMTSSVKQEWILASLFMSSTVIETLASPFMRVIL